MGERKEAVEEKFTDYLQQLQTYAERNHMGFIQRTFGREKLDRLAADLETQAGTVIDAAADYAVNDTEPREYHREFLDSNPFYNHYRGNDRRDLARDLLTHFNSVVTDAAPLFTADVDDPTFENLMREAYDSRDEAAEMLEENITYTEKFEDYTADMYVVDAGLFNVVNPMSFERAVLPKIEDAQDWLWEDVITEDLDDIYGDAADDPYR